MTTRDGVRELAMRLRSEVLRRADHPHPVVRRSAARLLEALPPEDVDWTTDEALRVASHILAARIEAASIPDRPWLAAHMTACRLRRHLEDALQGYDGTADVRPASSREPP